MTSKKQLKEVCNLFNKGILKVEDAVSYGYCGYYLKCKNGKVLEIIPETITKEQAAE